MQSKTCQSLLDGHLVLIDPGGSLNAPEHPQKWWWPSDVQTAPVLEVANPAQDVPILTPKTQATILHQRNCKYARELPEYMRNKTTPDIHIRGPGEVLRTEWKIYVISHEYVDHETSTSPRNRTGRWKNLFMPKCTGRILNQIKLQLQDIKD